MRTANRETLLIAQIETAAGLANVNEIAAVEGIDVLWIGHFDLSNSLGIPGQFDHPLFVDALAQVLAPASVTAKAPGFHGQRHSGRQKLARSGISHARLRRRLVALSGFAPRGDRGFAESLTKGTHGRTSP